MAFLTVEWNEEYALGIDNIDAQHRNLFLIMDKISLLNAESPMIKEKIREIFYELSKYMQQHFSDEEEYMKMIGFPEIDHHKKLHEKIIDQVKAVASNGSNLGIIQTKLKFLVKKAMLDHVVHEDMKIKLFQIKSPSLYDDCTIEFESA
jgi:hemerythrin